MTEKEKKMISVIVPVYNVEKFIGKCIESIIGQTYKNLEIILVDDGSTDMSGKICDKYREVDNRIIVVHKPQGGVSTARNCGMDLAKGSYIAFLDSDDYFAPDALEYLLDRTEKAGATIVVGREQIVSENEEIIGEDFSMNAEISEEIISEKEFWNRRIYSMRSVLVATKLYPAELVKDVRFLEISRQEDEAFLLDVISRSKNILYTDKVIIYYRQREGSLMHTEFNITNLSLAKVLLKEIDYMLTKQWISLAMIAFGRGTRNLSSGWKLLGKDRSAETVMNSICIEYDKVAKKIISSTNDIKIKARLQMFLISKPLYFTVCQVKNKGKEM